LVALIDFIGRVMGKKSDNVRKGTSKEDKACPTISKS
jgi:hypothetical protein